MPRVSQVSPGHAPSPIGPVRSTGRILPAEPLRAPGRILSRGPPSPVPDLRALDPGLTMARPSPSALTHLRGVAVTVPWLAWLLIADVLLSLLLPFKPFLPDLVYDLSSKIAYSVWRWIQYIFEGFNGATVTTSGDTLPVGESAIVVANHVGWSDFYMIQALAVKAGMLGRCRWFAKIQLRSVPFLGWGLWAMGFPLVSRNWMKDKAELDRVFRGIVERRWPTCRFSHASRLPY